MASGSPSSRRQIDTMTGAVSWSTVSAMPWARARSTNSATASEDSGTTEPGSPARGSDNDGTR